MPTDDESVWKKIADAITGALPIIGPLKRYFEYIPGMESADYGECATTPVDCEESPGYAVEKCTKCVTDLEKRFLGRFIPVGILTASSFAIGGILTGAGSKLIKDWLMTKLRNAGLRLFAGLVPIIGILYLISTALDLMLLVWRVVHIMRAAEQAQKAYCHCPP